MPCILYSKPFRALGLHGTTNMACLISCITPLRCCGFWHKMFLLGSCNAIWASQLTYSYDNPSDLLHSTVMSFEFESQEFLYPSICGYYLIKDQEYLYLVFEIQPTFATVSSFFEPACLSYKVSVILRLHAVLIYERTFISPFHYWGHLCFYQRHQSPPPRSSAAMSPVCFTLQRVCSIRRIIMIIQQYSHSLRDSYISVSIILQLAQGSASACWRCSSPTQFKHSLCSSSDSIRAWQNKQLSILPWNTRDWKCATSYRFAHS